MTKQSIYSQPHADLYSSSNNFAFGFPPAISTNLNTNKKPPTSAPTSLKNKHPKNQTRPESLQHRRAITSPESQLLDKWSEDLRQYEMVLDSMVSTSLDNNVKEEIKHVDQWYRYLSETERTATMYALLQHSTPLQNRFFITVLQQLGKKDPVTSLLSPVYAEYDIPQMDPAPPNPSSRETIIGDIHPTRSKNRRSYAFGEVEESLFHHQPYTSFAEASGVLGSSSSSSSSSSSASCTGGDGGGQRQLSDDFLDTSITAPQFSASATNFSNWSSQQSMNTGLRTGNQDTSPSSSYSRHSGGNRPKSADISHWSFGVSPSPPNNNRCGNNHHPHHHHHQTTSSFLPPPPTADILPVTPTTPTRLSWHGFPSLAATNQFSDPIFGPPSSSSGRKATEVGYVGPGCPVDSLTDKLNQWSLYPSSDLTSNDNSKRQLQQQHQPQYKHWMNGNDTSPSHQVYPGAGTQQPPPPPSSSISSALPHTVHSNHNHRSGSFGLGQYDLYDNNDQKINNTLLFTKPARHSNAFTTQSHFTGMQHKNRHHLEQVQIKLLEDIPTWLKSLRLHKYTELFRSMTWQAMVQLSDDDLKAKGVVALGARRKLLKVFDQVKTYCDKNDIKYGPD